MVQEYDHMDEGIRMSDISLKEKWAISCPECEDEIEADYDGTHWICKACGYLTDGPEGIVNVSEREEFRKEWEADKWKRAEEKFYEEYGIPNDRDMLFFG